MELTITGLPKSGKTTLFNALTRGHAQTAPYPGSRVQPHLGTVKVPDPRLQALAGLLHPQRVVPAEIMYVDLPGVPEGARLPVEGETLNILQRADALLLVVRAFSNPAVPHPSGSVDPWRDLQSLGLELAYADLDIVQRRLERLERSLKGAKAPEREAVHREEGLLQGLRQPLEAGESLHRKALSSEQRVAVLNYQLLTAKPLLVLLNVGEEQVGELALLEERLQRNLEGPWEAGAALCGQLEMELAQMPEAEAAELRSSLGLGEAPGLERAVRLSYQVLGLVSFFTTASSEVRAWSIPQGTPAVKAAGRIHTDMERGFIRAEVVPFEDLVRVGGFVEARRQGRLRLEGKTYEVQDGDVITFLFNV